MIDLNEKMGSAPVIHTKEKTLVQVTRNGKLVNVPKEELTKDEKRVYLRDYGKD